MLRWLQQSIAQGSNDAFVEQEIITGLSNVTRSAYRIRRLEFLVPQLPGVDAANFQLALKRISTASMSLAVGNALIAGCMRGLDFTTSGTVTQDLVIVYTYPRDEELLIVEDTLYLTLDSNATSASNTASIRIGYEVRTITENERLTIQASSAA